MTDWVIRSSCPKWYIAAAYNIFSILGIILKWGYNIFLFLQVFILGYYGGLLMRLAWEVGG